MTVGVWSMMTLILLQIRPVGGGGHASQLRNLWLLGNPRAFSQYSTGEPRNLLPVYIV